MSALRDEDVAAVLDTLRSGWLTMGPRIQAFETAFAGWTGAPYAIACSSGTAALHLAMLALRLAPGERVLVPAVGGRAAAAAVRNAGGEPEFCDVVSPAVPVIDVLDVERRQAGARAVIAVHAYGHAADAGLLADLEIPLVEDCRAAIGAVVGSHDRQAGTLGLAGCFSFADGRQLPVGEGGMVTTADEDVAARVRLLRAHAMTSGTWDRHRGHSDTYDVVDVGFNFRLDEPRAALGSSRLSRLGEDLQRRRELAFAWRRAAEQAGAQPCFTAEDDASAAHGAFPVLVDDPERAIAALAEAGLHARREPALAPLRQANATAERLVVVALDDGADPAALTQALRRA